MVYLNKIIKQDLLRLFEEGKSENEAFEQLSKAHSSHLISLKVISNWFTKFRSLEHCIDDKNKSSRKFNFTDEYLINLINENPELNMTELSMLTNISRYDISKRLKQINSSEQKVNYIEKGFKNGAKRFSDEYLINLINENPGVNMRELAELVNTCISNISTRLKKINSNRSDGDKIVLKKKTYKTERKSHKTISNDSLIKLVNENPELSACELANLAEVSVQTIYSKLKKLNADDPKANYIMKSKKNGATKFTDEFIINLINENPDLNMDELAELTNTTQGTISNRLKQINIDRKLDIYIKKNTHRVPKFTDEYLINLINENPELNMSNLAKLAGASRQTISNILKRVNKDRERLITVKNGREKFSDEFLINLINDNPDLNMKQLSKLANASEKTISSRLKKINSNGEKVNYTKKY